MKLDSEELWKKYATDFYAGLAGSDNIHVGQFLRKETFNTILEDIENQIAEYKKVPDGWQLVPREPTREMILRGYAGWIAGTPVKDEYRAGQCYQSMLAASPKVKT